MEEVSRSVIVTKQVVSQHLFKNRYLWEHEIRGYIPGKNLLKVLGGDIISFLVEGRHWLMIQLRTLLTSPRNVRSDTKVKDYLKD